jgi:gas vesicle protein
MKGFISFLVGLLMGGLVGATLAVLLAPTSGADLRGQIQDRAQRIQLDVKEAASTRRAELEQQLAALRSPNKPGAV